MPQIPSLLSPTLRFGSFTQLCLERNLSIKFIQALQSHLVLLLLLNKAQKKEIPVTIDHGDFIQWRIGKAGQKRCWVTDEDSDIENTYLHIMVWGH